VDPIDSTAPLYIYFIVVLYFSGFLRVLKWGLLFDERRGYDYYFSLPPLYCEVTD
jgi:hypothetical protein